MKKNELNDVIKLYKNADSTTNIITWGIFNNTNRLIEAYQKMKDFEKPDIISELDTEIIGTECFKYDSYEIEKGSKYIKETKKIDKELQEDLNKLDNGIITKKLILTGSLSNYYNNFRNVFSSHCGKINSYIDNINTIFPKNSKEIKFWFFAHDNTRLGNAYRNEETEKLTIMNPFLDSDNINILEMHPEVEMILLGRSNAGKREITAIQNSIQNIKLLREESKTIKEKDFSRISENYAGFHIKFKY